MSSIYHSRSSIGKGWGQSQLDKLAEDQRTQGIPNDLARLRGETPTKAIDIEVHRTVVISPLRLFYR